MIFYVYTYFINGVPEYVGKGTDLRMLHHFVYAQTHWANHLRKAVRTLQDVKCVVDYFTDDERNAFELERVRIQLYGRIDTGSGTLWNRTAGGEGVHGHRKSAETIAKFKATMARPEVRARNCVARSEISNRPEVRANMAAAQRIAQNRPERKAKNSETMKRVWAERRAAKAVNSAQPLEET